MDRVLTIIAFAIHIFPIAAVQYKGLSPIACPIGHVHDVDTLLVALVEDPFVFIGVAYRRRSECGRIISSSTRVSGLDRTVVEVAMGIEVV